MSRFFVALWQLDTPPTHLSRLYGTCDMVSPQSLLSIGRSLNARRLQQECVPWPALHEPPTQGSITFAFAMLARRTSERVQEMIRDIKRGRLTVPEDARWPVHPFPR